MIECKIRELKKRLIQSHLEIDAAGIQFSGPCHASSLPLGGGLKQYGYQIISNLFQLQKSILFYHFTPSKFETCRIEVETTGQGTESLPSSSCTRSLPPGLPGPFVFNYLTGRRTESEDRIASTSYAKAIALQMSVFTVICCRKTWALPMTALNPHHNAIVGRWRTGCLKMCKDKFHGIPPCPQLLWQA